MPIRRNRKQDARLQSLENVQAQIRYYQSVKRDFATRREILDRQIQPLLKALSRLTRDFAQADSRIAELKVELAEKHVEFHQGPKIDKLKRMRDAESRLTEEVPEELQ